MRRTLGYKMTDHSVYVDGILYQWGDRAFIKHVSVRRPSNIKKGAHTSPKKPPAPKNGSLHQQLKRTLVKTPEVLVKISGGSKDMGGIKAHLDYITRHGDLEIEDESGNVSRGKQSTIDTKEAWKYSGVPIKEDNGRTKEAINIVLSMPAGTNPESVTNAAREFAKEQFENHQYSFVTHTDTGHPHVHLVVKSVDMDGQRLSPRKADIQEYRERFAEKLRDNGIQANATSRTVRGIVRKYEKKNVLETDKRLKKYKKSGKKPFKEPRAKRKMQQQKIVDREIKQGQKHVNPAAKNIKEARTSLNELYTELHKALKGGTDNEKKLARLVHGFATTMPDTKTRHEQKLTILKKQDQKDVTRDIEPDSPSMDR